MTEKEEKKETEIRELNVRGAMTDYLLFAIYSIRYATVSKYVLYVQTKKNIRV